MLADGQTGRPRARSVATMVRSRGRLRRSPKVLNVRGNDHLSAERVTIAPVYLPKLRVFIRVTLIAIVAFSTNPPTKT
eukprot:scaffold70542_cov63-Phaeocystis_antarctica.AAC.2